MRKSEEIGGKAYGGLLILAGFLYMIPQIQTLSGDQLLFNQELRAEPVEIRQAGNQEYRMEYHFIPQRVIVTHPGAAELLLELGLGDKILAAVRPYDKPLPHLQAQYRSLPQLSARYTPGREELLGLEPDLLIGWEYQFDDRAMGSVLFWQQHKAAVYIVPDTFYDQIHTFENTVYPFLTDMGKIFQKEAEAERLIQKSREHLKILHEKIPGDFSERKTAIFLQNHGDGIFSLYGEKTLLSFAGSEAGLKNICPQGQSFVSAETVLSYDPDYIVFIPNHGEQERLEKEQALKQIKSMISLRSMKSMQSGKIIPIDFSEANDGALRILQVVDQLVQGISPIHD